MMENLESVHDQTETYRPIAPTSSVLPFRKPANVYCQTAQIRQQRDDQQLRY